uniref:(northern house mosquito) hypothetical protein n=1 Tax=Culex pipiens TaxID=7175 RepID=A0A8D8HCU4_CULPI
MGAQIHVRLEVIVPLDDLLAGVQLGRIVGHSTHHHRRAQFQVVVGARRKWLARFQPLEDASAPTNRTAALEAQLGHWLAFWVEPGWAETVRDLLALADGPDEGALEPTMAVHDGGVRIARVVEQASEGRQPDGDGDRPGVPFPREVA